jgi:hypothetical protein
MEKGILSVFHDEYSGAGFPAADRIEVVCREETGAGRVIKICSQGSIALDDGYYDMAGKYIEIAEVSGGLMAIVSIAGSKLEKLEISTYGDAPWSGKEVCWTIQ